jgi:signal transduction histidine kinase
VFDDARNLSSVRTDFGFYLLCVLAVAAGLVTGELNARGRRLQTLAEQLRLEREERARTAVLQERTHIARELHDVVAHSISVMVVQVGGARRIMQLEPDTAREALTSAEQTGRQALAELRRLLGVLRSVGRDNALAPQPGLAQLDQLVAQMCQSGLSVSVAVDGVQQALSPGIDLAAYRIVQEALTNTLKHSTGTHASVRLCWKPERLGIVISDDGVDKPRTAAQQPGHGLIGMRERVALYGGSFSAERNGHGFVVTAELPLADR